MKNFIIGIDVSKDTLDFCILEKDNRKKFMQGVIANKEKDILTWLRLTIRTLFLNSLKAYVLQLNAYCGIGF
ncbi:hypothetical protein [Bergeyella porcorum]|uniref:hypothetical protein n=1 Tax=Bergeyella porcorum TaxID=1735111 RepID=UPI00366CD662